MKTPLIQEKLDEKLNALDALGGEGQEWVNVTASRALNTNYTNDTGRPIAIIVDLNSAGVGASVRYRINGEIVSVGTFNNGPSAPSSNILIVPDGDIYRAEIIGDGTMQRWSELR